jgi:putative mRNA 3-end processing factor
LRPQGLYCPLGDFYIDPWKPVARAIITHAHADHARTGHGHYLAAQPGLEVLRSRLGAVSLEGLNYGQSIAQNGVKVSLHPAGHVLGSAQVRLEYQGRVWVVSGDYKTAGVQEGTGDADPTATPFEPVACNVFVTESTFGLPIYRWPTQQSVYSEINQWWAKNALENKTSLVLAYSFGKAQRILAGLDTAIGPIFCHGAVENLNAAYRASGVSLPPTSRLSDESQPARSKREAKAADLGRAIVLAPPSAAGSPWLRRLSEYSDAFASGWMQVRGARRRQGLDRGFVLSDHADWPGLLWAIEQCQAPRVIVTHGQSAPLVRWLRERGLDAQSFETRFGDEEEGGAAQVATLPQARMDANADAASK